jgi:hypothetical protein
LSYFFPPSLDYFNKKWVRLFFHASGQPGHGRGAAVARKKIDEKISEKQKIPKPLKREKHATRTQSYDLLIYSYNASVVIAYSVFQNIIKYFLFSKRARLTMAL